MTRNEIQIIEEVRKYDRILAQQVKAIIDARDEAQRDAQTLREEVARLQALRRPEPGQTKWFPPGS